MFHLLVLTRIFTTESLWFFLHIRACHLWTDIILALPFWFECLLLLFLISLTMISNMMSCISGESGHPSLLQSLEKEFSAFLKSMILSTGLHMDLLFLVLLRFFVMKACWRLSNAFYYICWEKSCDFILCCGNVVYHTEFCMLNTEFCMLKQSFMTGINLNNYDV